ncbi:malate synthase A, partial [Streptomyces rubiginosohelvolus]
MTTLATTGRVQVLGVPGDRHEEVLTPEALDFIGRLDAAFAARCFDLLTERRGAPPPPPRGPPPPPDPGPHTPPPAPPPRGGP